MREQLRKYVDLLFAGVPDSDDIKQEILQNTLDRYDDLISQGKPPAAAYSLSISGIGDINEILDSSATAAPAHTSGSATDHGAKLQERKLQRAVAIAMYILCPVPLFILSEFGLDTIGLCFTLLLVAAATALMILSGKGKSRDNSSRPVEYQNNPRQELRRSIKSVIWAVGLGAYFLMSILTQAWYITWIIFPLIASVQGLVMAIMDLKEAQ